MILRQHVWSAYITVTDDSSATRLKCILYSHWWFFSNTSEVHTLQSLMILRQHVWSAYFTVTDDSSATRLKCIHYSHWWFFSNTSEVHTLQSLIILRRWLHTINQSFNWSIHQSHILFSAANMYTLWYLYTAHTVKSVAWLTFTWFVCSFGSPSLWSFCVICWATQINALSV